MPVVLHSGGILSGGCAVDFSGRRAATPHLELGSCLMQVGARSSTTSLCQIGGHLDRVWPAAVTQVAMSAASLQLTMATSFVSSVEMELDRFAFYTLDLRSFVPNIKV
jgi:hypothetical protein